MGDIADMMLDGTLCSGCGVYMHGKPDGIPRECKECARETAQFDKAARKAANIEKNARQKKAKCPQCGKRVKEIGLPQHIAAVHGELRPVAQEHGSE